MSLVYNIKSSGMLTTADSHLEWLIAGTTQTKLLQAMMKPETSSLDSRVNSLSSAQTHSRTHPGTLFALFTYVQVCTTTLGVALLLLVYY